MQIKHWAIAAILTTALSGCLRTDGERAVAGAAAGAIVAEALDSNVIAGAAIGAGAGALCDDAGICD